MTAVATIETIASDVVPTFTPSIGSGNASAAVAAARRPRMPASAVQPGGSPTSSAMAARVPSAPMIPTGTTTGSARVVSGFIASGDQRCEVGRPRHLRTPGWYGRRFAMPSESNFVPPARRAAPRIQFVRCLHPSMPPKSRGDQPGLRSACGRHAPPECGVSGQVRTRSPARSTGSRGAGRAWDCGGRGNARARGGRQRRRSRPRGRRGAGADRPLRLVVAGRLERRAGAGFGSRGRAGRGRARSFALRRGGATVRRVALPSGAHRRRVRQPRRGRRLVSLAAAAERTAAEGVHAAALRARARERPGCPAAAAVPARRRSRHARARRAVAALPLPDAGLIPRTYGWVLPVAPGSLHDWEIPALAQRVATADVQLGTVDPVFSLAAPLDALASVHAKARVAGQRLMLIALARGDASAESVGGGTGAFLLLLPALVVFAASVLAARLLAPGFRALGRAHGPLPLRLAALSLARRGGTAVVAAAFLVVSVGVALFAVSYRATLERGQRDQAAFAVPADYVLSEDLERLVPVQRFPATTFARLGESVSVVRASGDLRGRDVTLLGLPAQALARTRGWRDRPSGAVLGSLGPSARLRGLDLHARTFTLPLTLLGSPVAPTP